MNTLPRISRIGSMRWATPITSSKPKCQDWAKIHTTGGEYTQIFYLFIFSQRFYDDTNLERFDKHLYFD